MGPEEQRTHSLVLGFSSSLRHNQPTPKQDLVTVAEWVTNVNNLGSGEANTQL